MSEWEALRLIFLPGFSTAEKVTSISGRGVGMDVVRTNIEKIGGAVDIFNRPGINGPGAGSTVKNQDPAHAGDHSRPDREPEQQSDDR